MTAGLLHPKKGAHNVICDISGRKVRSDKTRKTWQNFITSEEDYDPKHPQLTLRPRSEKLGVKPTRVRPTPKFVTEVDPNSLNGKI